MTIIRGATEATYLAGKLNWLRAAVLGANDGIVSVSGLLMGVAGAQAGSRALLIAGLAGLVAGALSMAGGEYVSVSTQTDTERAALAARRYHEREQRRRREAPRRSRRPDRAGVTPGCHRTTLP